MKLDSEQQLDYVSWKYSGDYHAAEGEYSAGRVGSTKGTH